MNDGIVLDPKIQHGRPVIRGTRVPVAVIVGSLAAGMSPGEVVKDYGIAREVLACLSYATELLETEGHYPLSSSAP